MQPASQRKTVELEDSLQSVDRDGYSGKGPHNVDFWCYVDSPVRHVGTLHLLGISSAYGLEQVISGDPCLSLYLRLWFKGDDSLTPSPGPEVFSVPLTAALLKGKEKLRGPWV